MSFASLNLFRKTTTRGRSKSTRCKYRPCFEALELRCVLSSSGQAIAPGIELFNLVQPDARPDQILAGADGNLWFNEVLSNRVGRITPIGEITSYTDPSLAISSFANGPDGNIWFVFNGGSQIGRVTSTGVVRFR
jgi:streptogramin lyase